MLMDPSKGPKGRRLLGAPRHGYNLQKHKNINVAIQALINLRDLVKHTKYSKLEDIHEE